MMASAMIERAELPVQRNRTLYIFITGPYGELARSLARRSSSQKETRLHG